MERRLALGHAAAAALGVLASICLCGPLPAYALARAPARTLASTAGELHGAGVDSQPAHRDKRRTHKPAPPPRYPSSQRVIAAAHYLEGRAGEKAFAVIDNMGKLAGLNVRERFHSASVVKAMMLVAYLQTLAYERRSLRAADTALLYPMIHSSDNHAADGVFAVVGNEGLRRIARQAHMSDFEQGHGWWAFSEVSAADLARFFLVQDSLIPGQFVGYARFLLSTIEPSQSWGIPSVARAGRNPFQVFFKGGWLPKEEGLVNQAARLEHGGETFALAVLTKDDPSMTYGEETIAGVTEQLLGR